MKRGQRLVADDAVEISPLGTDAAGNGTRAIGNFVELRA
jgi:serine kinase of HPr protein (carbohydrate metabolism regulator)